MRLRDKVVVPPLSEAAEQRVERRFVEAVLAGEESSSVASAFRRSFATLGIGLAIAGVAIAIGINVQGALDNRANVVGNAQVSSTELTTGADAVIVRVGDATVSLAPESEAVLIRNPNGEVGIALRRGRVDCEVEPIPNRPTFWVGASDVTVRVVGTVFSVSHDPELSPVDRVQVGVERGRVAVSASGSEVFVSAGSQWSARDGVTSAVALVAPDGDAASNAAAGADNQASLAAKSGAADEVAKTAEQSSAITRSANKRGSTPSKKASEKASGSKKPALPGVRRLSPPTDDASLLDAMALDSSDPRAAIKAYTTIASKQRGAVASFALYSRAYVEYIKLGDRRAALRTLDLFRRRFPKARELESALWLQIKALCTGGQSERCRAAAHSYTRGYPSGRFVSGAQKIIDSL